MAIEIRYQARCDCHPGLFGYGDYKGEALDELEEVIVKVGQHLPECSICRRQHHNDDRHPCE